MTYKTQAIVLRSYSWPRQARLYVLYTQQFGKVRGVAAGISKIKSKVAGHLQPFSLTEVMMARGRTIDRLAQARLVRRFAPLHDQWSGLLYGSYILEVVDALTKEAISDAAMWLLIVEVLQELEQRLVWAGDGLQESMELYTRMFGLQMLHLVGLRPECVVCIQCKGVLVPERIFFSLLHGGTVCGNCLGQYPDAMPVKAELIKLMRAVLTQPLSQCSKLIIDTGLGVKFCEIIDQLMSIYTQKPLRSSQFIHAMKGTGYSV
jgi:DNA repair protein RecO (recombination protein O)